MTKIFVSIRDAKGRMRSVDLANAPEEVREAAAAALGLSLVPVATPAAVSAPRPVGRPPAFNPAVHYGPPAELAPVAERRGRGRPKGFQCSPETREKMSASWAFRRVADAKHLGQ